MEANNLIEYFKMQKHPEGGAFLETYRSGLQTNFPGFEGQRNSATAIYFLLQAGEISAFHRIKSDETWHFYLGESLEVVEIDLKGKLIRTKIGRDFINGENLQYTVKAGHWFASHSLGTFSFVGCTVAPGFDFNDFEMANGDKLKEQYPKHSEVISKFTY